MTKPERNPNDEILIPNFVIPHSSFVTFYASLLVLRKPVIRSPSFHWPRFLSNSRRSKRFRTLRLPPNVAAARRLRCCDINQIPIFLFSCFNPLANQSGGRI